MNTRVHSTPSYKICQKYNFSSSVIPELLQLTSILKTFLRGFQHSSQLQCKLYYDHMFSDINSPLLSTKMCAWDGKRLIGSKTIDLFGFYAFGDARIVLFYQHQIVYQHSLMFQSHGCGQRDTSPKRKAAWMKVFCFKIFKTLYRLSAILCLEKTAFMFSFDPNLPSSKRVSSPSRRIYPSLSAFLITRISNQNINALRLEITLIYHSFLDQFKQIAFPHSDVMHKHANSNTTLLFFL